MFAVSFALRQLALLRIGIDANASCLMAAGSLTLLLPSLPSSKPCPRRSQLRFPCLPGAPRAPRGPQPFGPSQLPHLSQCPWPSALSSPGAQVEGWVQGPFACLSLSHYFCFLSSLSFSVCHFAASSRNMRIKKRIMNRGGVGGGGKSSRMSRRGRRRGYRG